MSSEEKNISENKKETSEKNIHSEQNDDKEKQTKVLENQSNNEVKESEIKLLENIKIIEKKVYDNVRKKLGKKKEIEYLEGLINKKSEEIEVLKMKLSYKRKKDEEINKEYHKLMDEFNNEMKLLEEKNFKEFMVLKKEFFYKKKKIEAGEEKILPLAGPPSSKKNNNCEKTFPICIRNIINSTMVRISCSLNDKISEIIEIYKHEVNYEGNDKIFLLFNNQYLYPDETVSQYKLYPNCSIEVIINDS